MEEQLKTLIDKYEVELYKMENTTYSFFSAEHSRVKEFLEELKLIYHGKEETREDTSITPKNTSKS